MGFLEHNNPCLMGLMEYYEWMKLWCKLRMRLCDGEKDHFYDVNHLQGSVSRGDVKLMEGNSSIILIEEVGEHHEFEVIN